MKKFRALLMLAAIAVASLSIVSCDDDPWDDPYSHWHGWGDGYNQEETTIMMRRMLSVASGMVR